MAYSPLRKYKKKAVRRGREWLIRLLTALFSTILAFFGSWSYGQTGKVIPRRELLTGTASIHFIDVGQGDATLILTGDAAVLIDAGTSSSAGTLVEYVRTYAGRLDYLILTHPHDDHVGGADEILETIPTGRLLMPIVENNSYTDSLLATAEDRGIPVFDILPGSQYTAGEITCTMLGPIHKNYDNLNNVSAVIRVDVGGTSLLLSGDAEQEAELDVLMAGNLPLLDCDIYQVGHHGSSTSTSLEFFTAVSPDHCVISCGYGNDYGHPHTTVLQLLTLSGASVYRTDTEGTVVLETDGKTITRRGSLTAAEKTAS
ncbi:MAG: MBL fold metallo-hydrolase [Clostridia bacterium]|nr:MBL fold metallo-hydrolase [Clostridia bacterium]